MVQLRFQSKPWDVYASVMYTLIISSSILTFGRGNLLGILLVLFVPGYLLVALIFPENRDIDWIERLCLSIGLSILIVPLLAFLLNFSPWGISLDSVVMLIDLFTIAVSIAAVWRRNRLEPGRRLAAMVDFSIKDWRQYRVFDKLLSIFLVIGISVAIGVLGSLILAPPSERFTEFYALGPSVNASGYPTALNISEEGSVILGITNHESSSVNYTVRIDLIGVRLVFNATAESNETVEVNRTTWSTLRVTLADRQNWTERYTFRINYFGLWKVQFLLFMDNDFSSVYRGLHLFVRVT